LDNDVIYFEVITEVNGTSCYKNGMNICCHRDIDFTIERLKCVT